MATEPEDSDIFYDAIDDQESFFTPTVSANSLSFLSPASAPNSPMISPSRGSVTAPSPPTVYHLLTQPRSIPVHTHKKTVKEFGSLALIQETPINTGEDSAIWVARFSRSGGYFAVSGQTPTIWLYVTSADTVFHLYRSYIGHKKPVIDITWSSDDHYFLSSSMDKDVLLWQTESSFPLHRFSHPDIVSCVNFSPFSDDFFYTGCFDRLVRLWKISGDRVESCYQTPELVTALGVSESGMIAIGLRTGLCILCQTAQDGKLRFVRQVDCKNRKGRKSGGRKVTGIEFCREGMLVSTNDSRARLISLEDFTTRQKYKGARNECLPIKSSFSPDFTHVISGSDTGQVYIWSLYTSHVPYCPHRANRNTSYEVFQPCSHSNSRTTCALFAPLSLVTLQQRRLGLTLSHVVVTVGSEGVVRVYGNIE